MCLKELPDDILDIIADKLENPVPFLSTCKPIRNVFYRHINSLSSQNVDESDRDLFLKNLSQSYMFLKKAVFRVHKNRNYDTEYHVIHHIDVSMMEFRNLETLVIDSNYLPIFRDIFTKPLLSLEVYVRKKHGDKNIDLHYIPTQELYIHNKKIGFVKRPEKYLSIPYEIDKTDYLEIEGLYSSIKKIEIEGAFRLNENTLSGIKHRGNGNMHTFHMTYGIISCTLPSSLEDVSLQDVLVPRSMKSSIFQDTKKVRSLKLENMGRLTSTIPMSIWESWKQTLTVYEDIFTLTYVQPWTEYLEKIEEFHISPGNEDFGPYYLQYGIPKIHTMKRMCLERVLIPRTRMHHFYKIRDAVIENCKVV